MSGPFQSTIPVRKRKKYAKGGKCKRPTCRRRQSHGCRGFCTYHCSAYLNENGVIRGKTDATPVAEHIAKLSEAGIGAPSLARLIGFPTPTLSRIKFQKRVLTDTAQRVLAVPLPTSPLDPRIEDRRQVAAIGTVRRLQALQAYGYNMEWVARESGLPAETLRKTYKHEYVLARIARTVDATFQRLQMVQGTDVRAMNKAKQHGWAPPFAWDEDSIDDPNAKPINPKNHRDAWLEDYQELQSLGKTIDQIAERMGVTTDSLKTRLRRHNALTSSNQEHQ